MPKQTTGWTSTEFSTGGAGRRARRDRARRPAVARRISASSARSAAGPAPVARVRACTDAAGAIRAGEDPLGDRLIAARPQAERRQLGQVFTPAAITGPMVGWTLEQAPTRRHRPGLRQRTLRAGDRAAQRCAGRRRRRRPPRDSCSRARASRRWAAWRACACSTPTTRRRRSPKHRRPHAFIGNPPYVRHHDLTADAKAWARLAAGRFGARLSGLAGYCTPTSSSRLPSTGGPATSAASSPVPSGST